MDSTEVEKNGKRVANFSAGERELLVSIITKYKDIFSGRSDNSSRVCKNKMWEQVHKEFNAEARGCSRSLKSLQVFWKNIKKRTKDVEGEIRRQRYVTGGGPPILVHVDRVHESIKELMGPAAEGMDNPFDSDGQNMQRLNEVNELTMEELEDEGELIEPTVIPHTAADTPAARWCSRRRPRMQQAAELFYLDENKKKQQCHDRDMECHDRDRGIQDLKIFAMREDNRRQEEMHALRMAMLKRNMEK